MSSLETAAVPSSRVAIVRSRRRWRWVEWFVYVLVTLLIVGRFFTERYVILPRFVNAIDLITVPLLIPVALLSIVIVQRGWVKGRPIIFWSLFFLVAWIFAWLLNSEVHWLGATLFLVGIMTPILFYLLIINLGFGTRFVWGTVSLLKVLLLINLIIGTYDIYTGIGTGADFVFGTFGVNNNQFAFFLAIMIAYYMAQWRYGRFHWTAAIILAWTVVVFLLCGFQTLWVVLVMALGLVYLVLAHWSRRLLPIVAAALLVPVIALSLISFQRFDLGVTVRDGLSQFDQLGKVQLIKSLPAVWQSRPWAFLIGVGPGTFNSRAFRSIAVVPYQGAGVTDVAAAIVEPFYRSDLSAKYIIPYFERGVFLLSGSNTDGPFTSYVSIPVEVGLLGAVAVFAIYFGVGGSLIRSLRRSRDPQERMLAAWALVAMLTLLGIALVDNFLEVTRMTLLVWLVVGLWGIYRERRQRVGMSA